MASYQIPQFLDSGDKILGPLNVRQFGYAMFGGFMSVLIFVATDNLIPGIGNYAIIPAIPFIIIFGYLALGRYNGRDSEVYVLKIILYYLKPRFLIYDRIPDLEDLNTKLASSNPTAIQNTWNQRVQEEQMRLADPVNSFRGQDSQAQAATIRSLSFRLDTSLRNTLQTVKQKEFIIEQKDHALQVIDNIKRQNRQYSQSPLLQQPPRPTTPLEPLPIKTSSTPNPNFFEVPKSDV